MSASKAIKAIIFTAASQEHHTLVKVKSVLKWLKAGHEVRVQINGKSDRQKLMDNIFKQLERETKVAAVIKQKVVKPESIRFNMKPTSDAANLIIRDTSSPVSEDLDNFTDGKDVFSDDFERELDKLIEEEKSKRK